MLPPNRLKRLNTRIANVRGRLEGMPRPPARQTAQLPWDAQYESEVAQQNLGYNNKIAGLQAQEMNVQGDYGINDTSNPFSRARLLQQSFDQARQRTWNSATAAGQGYSGSTSAAITADQSAYNQDYNNLRNEYSRSLADIDSQRSQALQDQQGGILSAKAAALERAINRPLDPSTSPADPRQPLEQRLARLRAKRQNIVNQRKR